MAKGTKRRVGQHHGDLRAALLDAALAEVAEGKAESLSLRGVARRAGVSPAAPYHHFADKDALLAAVASDGFIQLNAVHDRVRAEHTMAERVLSEMVEAYVRFAIAHPAHYVLMFRASPGEQTDESGALQKQAMRSFVGLCTAIAGVNPGLAEAELRARAILAWSMAHGAVQMVIHDLMNGLDPDMGSDPDLLARRMAQTTLLIARAPLQQTGGRSFSAPR
ncbi:MAG: TetR/AcrR family transcriptional regulator [Myxococcota bacterium]